MNKYEKRMNWILNRRRKLGVLKKSGGTTEKHHIIPRSLGGTDSSENLIELTTREHFLVHYCLWKMYPKDSAESRKMVKAFTMMAATPSSAGKKRYLNSRLYAAAQVQKSKAMSIAQKGSKNSQAGSQWIYCYDKSDPHNKTKRQERKIKKDDEIPEGWHSGRKMTRLRDCANPKCTEVFQTRSAKKKYCQLSCQPTKQNMVERNKKAFIEKFKECGVMSAALMHSIGRSAVGDHAVNARKILEEEGLIHLLKLNRKE